jgi:hypothetical protein
MAKSSKAGQNSLFEREKLARLTNQPFTQMVKRPAFNFLMQVFLVNFDQFRAELVYQNNLYTPLA